MRGVVFQVSCVELFASFIVHRSHRCHLICILCTVVGQSCIALVSSFYPMYMLLVRRLGAV
jgi:hypothetical protein